MFYLLLYFLQQQQIIIPITSIAAIPTQTPIIILPFLLPASIGHTKSVSFNPESIKLKKIEKAVINPTLCEITSFINWEKSAKDF